MKEITASEYGLKKPEIINALLQYGMQNNNYFTTDMAYVIINNILNTSGNTLSLTGKASVRRLINCDMVSAGLIHKYDKNIPGWYLTDKATEVLNIKIERTNNVPTKTENISISNTVRGALFETYCLDLLKIIYPSYTWYHQGLHKKLERGLDLIGKNYITKEVLGIQVKNHNINNSPSKEEWTKFLAGCFLRKVDHAIFITTGILTSDQHRDCNEANITVFEGINEIHRIATQYNYKEYTEC